MNKVKDFYLKHQMIIALSVMTALTLLAFYDFYLWIIPSVAVAFFYATGSFEKNLCYTVYMSVFSGKSPIFATCLIFFFLTTTIFYVIDVRKKEKPFLKFQFFFTLAFIVLFSVVSISIDVNGFYNFALIVCLLMFLYYFFIYKDKINVKKCFELLFIAILVSAVLALMLSPFEVFRTKVYPFDGTYYRLRLFTLNVNHLAMFCMMSISYIIYNLINNHISKPKSLGFLKDKKFWFEILKLAFVLIVGLLTLSKAFVVVFVLVALYVVIWLVYKLKLKSLFIIVPVAVAVAVLCLIFNDFVYKMISRFFVYDEWGSLLSRVFTGRTDIWQNYIEFIFSSPKNILFGAGLFAIEVNLVGPHSVLLYVLFRVGFVGIVALGVLFYSYFSISKTKMKLTLANCLPILVFSLFALEEMILCDRFFVLLACDLLVLLKQSEKMDGEIVKIEKNSENFEIGTRKL